MPFYYFWCHFIDFLGHVLLTAYPSPVHITSPCFQLAPNIRHKRKINHTRPHALNIIYNNGTGGLCKPLHDYDYKNKLFDFFIFLNRAVGSNDLIGVWGGVGGSAAKGRVAVPKRMNFQKKFQTALTPSFSEI